ncbi:MGA_1079 family surface serine endopeptidase [Metamycoplasma spumans]|uniref:MGA_1079 family surface serine endopeptidase n=1 Tax=Metamycoplasma spumans TaxID=92406 RepID=UPI0034DD8E3F
MKKNNKNKLAIKGSGIALLTALFSIPVILQSCARPKPNKDIEKDDDQNKNTNKQKISDIELILNNGNLTIPSNLRLYLISLKNNDELLNNIDTNLLKENINIISTLLKEKNTFEKSNLNATYKSFLNKITNTNIDAEILKENEYIAKINVNSDSSISYINENIQKINNTSNLIKEYNNVASLNKSDFENLLNLFNNSNSVFSDNIKDQIINNQSVQAYKKDGSLIEIFNKYQSINTKANQLLEIKNSLENKENKNEKQTELATEIKQLFNENKIKDEELNNENIISKIQNLINKANQLQQADEGERNKINNLREQANTFINSLANLSDDLKNSYKSKINSLSLENLIDEVKQRAEQFNNLVNDVKSAINEANDIKNQPKYINATNNAEFDQKLAELNALIENDKLLNNSDYVESSNKITEINSLITELRHYSENLNGQQQDQPDDKVEAFKRSVEERLTPSFNARVSAYNLENSIYAVNINESNRKLFLSDPIIEGVELTYKNMELVDGDVNQLKLTYLAKDKTDSSLISDVSKIFTFKTNFNNEIDKLQYENLDALFEINYDELKNNYQNTFLSSEELKNKYFVVKHQNLHGFFTYRLKLSSFAYANSKLSSEVEFLVNNKVIKTLSLQTNQTFEFKDEFWEGISITMGDWFKNSQFYDDSNYLFTRSDTATVVFPIWGKQNTGFNTWFTIEVFNEVKNSIPELANKTLESQVNLINPPQSQVQNALTPEEIKRVINVIKSEWISKLFNIQVSNDATWQLLNFDDTHIFKSERLKSNEGTFKFLVTKNGVSKEISISLMPKIDNVEDQDTKDLNYLKSLIMTDKKDDASKILELVKVKEPGKTHNQYNSKDAVSALNDLYELPKKGKFEIYADSLVSYNNFENSTVGGTAKVFFWFKENGQIIDKKSNKYLMLERSFTTYAKTIQYFRPLSYRDIKPANPNEWFKQSDFSSSNINNDDKLKINKINSHNFDVRKATGAIVGPKSFEYTVIDPKDIVAQNAGDMLNYLLKLKTSNSEDTSDNSKFTNTAPSSGNKDDQPITNNASKTGDFWVSSASIINPSDTANNVDLSSIEKNYFIYYYDVQSNADNQLSFKLGFINKADTTKRYSNNQTITLNNLRNDYKENLYPEIMLNSIKYSDISINNISNKTINEFSNIMKGSDKNAKQSYISLKNSITYKNFTIDKSNFEVADAKAGEGNSVYIKFKVTNPTTNKTYIGNIWYKVSGFRDTSSSKENLDFKYSSLNTVFESSSEIKRTRELEPYYEDLLWDLDKENQVAKWTLKEKYIKNTFLKNNATNRKFKLRLFANQLIQDDDRLKRISDPNKNYLFGFNFDELANGQEVTKNEITKTYNNLNGGEYPRINFTLKARYQAGEGIKFEVELTDKQYKLFVGNPFNEALPFAEVNKADKYGTFDKNKAFLINNSGASITIEYTNSIEHESFDQETNLFDYKKLDYSQENQPILFYTPESTINSQEYNPNQNVSYELHNGYLQDQEYMHNAWENIDIVKNVRARSFAFNQGTATMLAKVNDNPNDGRFYIITNNHVEHISNISEVQGENLPKAGKRKYITKTSNNFGNNVDNGFSYWGGLDVANSVPIEVIWSGVDQISEKGEKKAGLTVDITVFAVDINPLIANAKLEGKFELAQWFENWFKLENIKMDYYGSKDGVHFGPNLKKIAMSGFPYGKQAGYLINRASSNSGNIALARQNGYVQTFYNAGNSGTGVLGQNNTYVSTINSGAPLTFLQSWNYETGFYNFLGVNVNKQSPLEINNTNSVGAQILRWNLKDPLNIKLPWFYKDIENK